MATTVRTCEGDLLDALCFAHYGHLQGCVEAVLDSNPGLARYGQPYPADLGIILPDIPEPAADSINLWD